MLSCTWTVIILPHYSGTSLFDGSPHNLQRPSTNPSVPLMINKNDSAQKESLSALLPHTDTHTQDLTLKSCTFFYPSWWKKFPLLPRIWSADWSDVACHQPMAEQDHCVFRCYIDSRSKRRGRREEEGATYEEKIWSREHNRKRNSHPYDIWPQWSRLLSETSYHCNVSMSVLSPSTG